MTTNISKWIDNYNTIQTNYQNYRQLGNCSNDCNTSCSDGFETDGTVVSGNNCNLNLITNPDGSVSYTRGCQVSCKYTNDKITSLMATWVQNNPLPNTTIVEESNQCISNPLLASLCECQKNGLLIQGTLQLNGEYNKKYKLDLTTWQQYMNTDANNWTQNYKTEKNKFSTTSVGTNCSFGCFTSVCPTGYTLDAGQGQHSCCLSTDVSGVCSGCGYSCLPMDSTVLSHMNDWVQKNPIPIPISSYDNSQICTPSYDPSSGNITCTKPTPNSIPISNVNIQCCGINIEVTGDTNISNVVNNCTQNINTSTPIPTSIPTSIPSPASTPTSTPITTPSTPSTPSTQTFGEKIISFITNKWFLLSIVILIIIITIIITVLRIFQK